MDSIDFTYEEVVSLVSFIKNNAIQNERCYSIKDLFSAYIKLEKAKDNEEAIIGYMD